MHDMHEKPIPSAGASLPLGLSNREKFKDTSPESLGEGGNEDNGKPKGPQKGSVPGGFEWG